MNASTAPAIGYSIVANLPGDRQVTVQCFVAEDEENEAVNKRLDRAFGFLDRQKARYEIPEIKDKIEEQEATLAQMERDLAAADEAFEKSQAELDIGMKTAVDTRDSFVQRGYNEHVASGRRGEYEPRGSDKARIDQHQSVIADYTAQKEKNIAEREQYRNNIVVGKRRYEAAIARDKEKLAEKEALLAADG